MRITEVKAYPLRAFIGRPVTGFRGHSSYSSRISTSFNSVYVNIKTDEGIEGWGESIARETLASASLINEYLAPLLISRDPLDNDVIWNDLFSTLRIRGHYEGIFVEALSGIDIALWDIKGKYYNKPVWKLIGGKYRDKVKAYASSVILMKPEEMAEEVRKLEERGFEYVKIKIGRRFEEDERAIKAIRETVGYKVKLIADANTAYNIATAIKVGRLLERYEFIWFEEPVPPDDLDGYQKISKTLDIPIAGAETFFSKYQWRDVINRGAIDIAMPDISRVGGITELMKIEALADSYNIPLTFHVGISGAFCRAASLQAIASTPNHLLFEPAYEYYYVEGNPLAYEVVEKDVEEFDGDSVIIGEKPGIGVSINRENLRKYIISL